MYIVRALPLALIVIYGLFLPQITMAAPTGLSILPAPILNSYGEVIDRPSWVVINGNPGSIITGRLTVINFDASPNNAIIYGAEATTDLDGGFIISSFKNRSNGIGSWSTVTPDTITIAANSSNQISYQIRIPKDASSGIYPGAFVIEKENNNLQASVFGVHSRVGVRIYLTVEGRSTSPSPTPGLTLKPDTDKPPQNDGAAGGLLMPSAPEKESTPATDKSIPETIMPFVDVKQHWAQEYIKEGYFTGVVQGRDRTHFEPEGLLTRAEMVKIALLIFDYKVTNSTQATFPDIASNAWHRNFIAAGKKAGILHGYKDGMFKPDQPVNRAEALKILLLASKLKNINTQGAVPFQDVPSYAWYRNYVSFAYENKVINGRKAKIFDPGGLITRAETLKIVILTNHLPK